MDLPDICKLFYPTATEHTLPSAHGARSRLDPQSGQLILKSSASKTEFTEITPFIVPEYKGINI